MSTVEPIHFEVNLTDMSCPDCRSTNDSVEVVTVEWPGEPMVDEWTCGACGHKHETIHSHEREDELGLYDEPDSWED